MQYINHKPSKTNKNKKTLNVVLFVGSVVERLEHRDCERHGLGSKPSRAIL